VDQNDTSTVANGEAGSDIRDALDALLADRTQKIRDDTFRDVQRAFDKRFSQQDQMIGTLTQVNERLSRFENERQQAEEANLDPEERAQRTTNRQTQQLYAQKNAAEYANLQNYVYGLALTEANEAGIKLTDSRISMDGAPKINENPNMWYQAMVREIARVQVADARSQTQGQIQAAVAEERRKILQTRETTRVTESNGRREAAAGQVERTVPSGTTMGMMERYRQLKADGKNKEARDVMEALGKQAKAGQLRTTEAG
jgi:hypothetical protein